MIMQPRPKGFKEQFARFFEEPSREALRDILKDSLGEAAEFDFKEAWPERSALARHILGFANHGGGCIVIGIQDGTAEPLGVNPLEDKAAVVNQVKKYLPGGLVAGLEVLDFVYEASEYPKLAGKSFQVVIVTADAEHLPYLSLRSGTSINEATVYIRRGAATEPANHEELQRVINRRIDTGYSSTREIKLQDHLLELKLLYDQLERVFVNTSYPFGRTLQTLTAGLLGNLEVTETPNPRYPSEDFEDFVVRMITLKKRRIEHELDVERFVGADG